MAIAGRLRTLNRRLAGNSSFVIILASCRTLRPTDRPENPSWPISKSFSALENSLIKTLFSKPPLKTEIQVQISGPFLTIAGPRFFSSEKSDGSDYSKEVDEINAKFAEAREEIDMALESKETVYFDEEAESARAVVKETLEMFEGLLARLPEAQRGVVQRSMGLKMEQLKAELEQLNE